MIKWILERKFTPQIDWDRHTSEFTCLQGALLGVSGLLIGYLTCYFLL